MGIRRREDHIRLLSVLPEKSSEGYVQCILFHSSIKEMEEAYTCLSYVWRIGFDSANQTDSTTKTIPNIIGDSYVTNTAKAPPADCDSEKSNPNIVIVNWKPMIVLQNLYDFLQVAHQKYPGEPFWIDALCINQNSTVERNHQVSQMGEIYSHARQVLAWMGSYDVGVNSLDVLRNKLSESRSPDEVHERACIPGSLSQGYTRPSQLTERLIWATRQLPELGWDNSSWPHTSIYQVWVLATDKRWEDRSYWAKVHNHLCLLDLISQHRYKKCLRGRDRVYSLRYLCVEGKGLQINYDTPSLDLLLHIMRILQRSPCLCAALALLGALGQDENSERWDSVYLAVRLHTWGSTASNHGARCTLREVCTGTFASLILNPIEGTVEYETGSGCQIPLPPSRPDVLHTWFEPGAAEEDKSFEGTTHFANGNLHNWMDDNHDTLLTDPAVMMQGMFLAALQLPSGTIRVQLTAPASHGRNLSFGRCWFSQFVKSPACSIVYAQMTPSSETPANKFPKEYTQVRPERSLCVTSVAIADNIRNVIAGYTFSRQQQRVNVATDDEGLDNAALRFKVADSAEEARAMKASDGVG
ncbi:HET-domain-containing protein [Karstenula rhodostoma CBS 690.94]|uniref:HET-domain-containing protein n=1 Tax=Karstenula rhodostoma CBS 690.94 TaxID=1392251 RepID=A0A9P4UF25_9PLEO|nr:HET-domain-containing protein [Karstenula rhodostoma CBS 690.94]